MLLDGSETCSLPARAVRAALVAAHHAPERRGIVAVVPGLVRGVDVIALPDLPGPGSGIQISCELRKQARRHPVEFVLGLFRQLRPAATEIVCGASGELPVRAGCAEAMPRSPEASVTATTDGLDNPVPPKPTRRPSRQDCLALRDVRRQPRLRGRSPFDRPNRRHPIPLSSQPFASLRSFPPRCGEQQATFLSPGVSSPEHLVQLHIGLLLRDSFTSGFNIVARPRVIARPACPPPPS